MYYSQEFVGFLVCHYTIRSNRWECLLRSWSLLKLDKYIVEGDKQIVFKQYLFSVIIKKKRSCPPYICYMPPKVTLYSEYEWSQQCCYCFWDK